MYDREHYSFLSDDLFNFLQDAHTSGLFARYPELAAGVDAKIREAQQVMHQNKEVSPLALDLQIIGSLASSMGHDTKGETAYKSSDELIDKFRIFSTKVTEKYKEQLQDAADLSRENAPLYAATVEEFAQRTQRLQTSIKYLQAGDGIAKRMQILSDAIEAMDAKHIAESVRAETIGQIYAATESYLKEG